ncbi:hypothetical protein POUND7_013758 [Theobroma cacao]
MVFAQIPGFASQHEERMNGHMIAHNRNHPFQHSYPQRAISANKMRNGHQIELNNEGLCECLQQLLLFSL